MIQRWRLHCDADRQAGTTDNEASLPKRAAVECVLMSLAAAHPTSKWKVA